MKIILEKNKLSQFTRNKKNLGFVPTMGGIHAGHISLITRSINECKKTIVSIFVNKQQFNRKSDFIKYPRALNKDISKLRKIGKDIYLDSRYYFDDNFKKSKVQEFYMNWVEKSVKKTFDDECYILLKKKNPIAYCSIKYLNNKESNIGLIGVDPEESGKGNGQIILNKVFNALYKKGIKRISVASQGRNYSAQRLYQKAGFLTSSTELWYHKWLY